MAQTLWLTNRSDELLDELQEELTGSPSKAQIAEEALEAFARGVRDDTNRQ